MAKLEHTEFRTYLLVDGKRVKNIIKRYACIPADIIQKNLIDLKSLRLSPEERKELNFFAMAYGYMNYLMKNEPYVYELIKDAKPIKVVRIVLEYSDPYYELIFDNKTRVKCSKKFCYAFDEKGVEDIYRNY